MYAGDGSAEYQQFWFEMDKAKSQYRPNQMMNFYVDPTQGHDDFLISLALLVEAAKQYSPRGLGGGLLDDSLLMCYTVTSDGGTGG